MKREIRNVLLVVGAVLAGLLLIGILFSGRPGDAIVADGTQTQQEEGTAEAPAEEAPAEETAEAPAEEEVAAAPEAAPAEEEAAAPAEEAPAGEEAATAADEAPAEDEAAPEEAPADEAEAADAEAADGDAGAEVALAGDPEAGERTFRQCQACHRIGEGAQNTVGPQLNGVVGRPIASVEGFNYSASMQALGEEGRSWTPDELRGFLADPQGYVPGTMMIYAGVRNEDDLENVIAYLATFEE